MDNKLGDVDRQTTMPEERERGRGSGKTSGNKSVWDLLNMTGC